MISRRCLRCARNAFKNSTCCSFLIEPSCNRNKQFVRKIPTITEMCVQLKWNWMTGVCPLGAQVRTRVGRSLIPDSSMKTISRSWRRAFF